MVKYSKKWKKVLTLNGVDKWATKKEGWRKGNNLYKMPSDWIRIDKTQINDRLKKIKKKYYTVETLKDYKNADKRKKDHKVRGTIFKSKTKAVKFAKSYMEKK